MLTRFDPEPSVDGHPGCLVVDEADDDVELFGVVEVAVGHVQNQHVCCDLVVVVLVHNQLLEHVLKQSYVFIRETGTQQIW